MISHLGRLRPTGSDTTMSRDFSYGGQEQNPVDGRGGDGSVVSAAVPVGGDTAGLGAPHDRRSGNTPKDWNPFFSCTGEDKDPARVVVIKTPVAARKAKVSAAGQALGSKPSKIFEGLLPRAFAEPLSTSRKHKKAAEEGDDNAEVAFFIPPSVKATLTRCAAQSRERVASGSAPAAGDGRGTRNAHLAASARSGRTRPFPVTPSLTPYATEHIHTTVSASSEKGAKCHFLTTANANGGDGKGGPVGGGGGLTSGGGGSSSGNRRNGDAGVAVCDVHAEEEGEGATCSSGDTAASCVGGRDEHVDGRRSRHAPGAPTGDEPLLGRPPGRDQPMGSGDIDNSLTEVLVADGGDENRTRVDERRGSSGGSDCVPTTSFSLRDLEAVFSSEEKAPIIKKASQVLIRMSEKSKDVSKVVASPFRRRGKSATP